MSTVVLLDATSRELEAGQWVVQPYMSSSSIYARVAYIDAINPTTGKVRLVKYTHVIPGEWVDDPRASNGRQRYETRPEDATWERTKTSIANTAALTIIDSAVAMNAFDGLAKWIENEWAGDPSGSIITTKTQII